MRGKDRVEASAELTAKLQPYIHPFLGILPRREDPRQDQPTQNQRSDANKTSRHEDNSSHDITNPATLADRPILRKSPVGGVTVRDVYPDSPAAKAGIKSGDRIVSSMASP